MRIALTGSHGYIGRNVRIALERAGHHVVCFDLRIGRPYLELLYETSAYDAILHLASFSKVPDAHKTHCLLAANVTDLATLMTGLGGYEGTFVFVSSSAVYALPASGPYGLTKALGEAIVEATLPYAYIVRPFNVIGGELPDDTGNDHLIPKLFEAHRSGRPFAVYWSGDERRYYVHVSLVVSTLLAIVDRQRTVPGVGVVGGVPARVVEVMSDRPFTVKEVVARFTQRWPVQVQYCPPRRDNPVAITSDGTAARISQSAEEALTRAFEDYERQLP